MRIPETWEERYEQHCEIRDRLFDTSPSDRDSVLGFYGLDRSEFPEVDFEDED